MRLAEGVENLAIVIDRIDVDEPGDRRRSDVVDPRQCFGELLGQRLAGVAVGAFAQDLARGRLAGDVPGDHVRAAEVRWIRRRGDDGRGRNPGAAGGADGRDLGRHVAYIAFTLTLQDQRLAVGLESPRFSRGATRQSGQVGDLGTPENGRKPVVEVIGHTPNEGQWAATVGYGLTAGPPKGWISKWR